MTGRAGRRGLDDEGHAIVCFASDLALQDVGRVALAPPADLHSSFRPTYNFTANLINHFDYDTALDVVRRSFAQFENDRRPAGRKRPLTDQMIARHRVLEELGYAEGMDAQSRRTVTSFDLSRVRSPDRRVHQRRRLSRTSSPPSWPDCCRASSMSPRRSTRGRQRGQVGLHQEEARSPRPPRPSPSRRVSANASARSPPSRSPFARWKNATRFLTSKSPTATSRRSSPPGRAGSPWAPCSTWRTPRSARRRQVILSEMPSK
jgi:hypothetical protein